MRYWFATLVAIPSAISGMRAFERHSPGLALASTRRAAPVQSERTGFLATTKFGTEQETALGSAIGERTDFRANVRSKLRTPL
jgi:hypothetical protein